MNRKCRAAAASLAVAVLAVSSHSAPAEYADLVLRGGRIVTVDAANPEVEALAVRGYAISALGSTSEIDAHVGPQTRVIDLGGRLAVPGFIEGHGHYLSMGEAHLILDLSRARSWEQTVAQVAEAAPQVSPGEWILGRGWHQEKWDSQPSALVEGVPVHAALSAATPANPVLLEHASGHAVFVNAQALALAGITDATPDPAGGTIVRDAAGAATGLLREAAQGLAANAYSEAEATRSAAERDARFRRQVELAGREALSKGVTSFHDAGVSLEDVDRYRVLADSGELPVRLYAMVNAPNDVLEGRLAERRLVASGNDHLAVRAIKRQIDGALGSHGAWLLEPYTDMPSTAGLVLNPLEQIERTTQIALAEGFQLAIHAIGDRGNREVLDLYQRAFASAASAADLRWRIEHAQHLHPDDIPRFAELGVIASMQAVHCTSDGPWVAKRLGEERVRSGAYVWRALLDSGAVVTNGTDVPVEDIDPIANFHAQVTRRLGDGSAFYPGQVTTRQEALRAYTLDNAYAAFEESLKGSLEVGKLADIVVLSQDILAVPAEQIPGTRVDYTIVGGEVRFERAR